MLFKLNRPRDAASEYKEYARQEMESEVLLCHDIGGSGGVWCVGGEDQARDG